MAIEEVHTIEKLWAKAAPSPQEMKNSKTQKNCLSPKLYIILIISKLGNFMTPKDLKLLNKYITKSDKSTVETIVTFSRIECISFERYFYYFHH